MNRKIFFTLFLSLTMMSLVFGSLPLAAAGTLNAPVGLTETFTPTPLVLVPPTQTPTHTPVPTNTAVPTAMPTNTAAGCTGCDGDAHRTGHGCAGPDRDAHGTDGRRLARHGRRCPPRRRFCLAPAVDRWNHRRPGCAGFRDKPAHPPPHPAISPSCTQEARPRGDAPLFALWSP